MEVLEEQKSVRRLSPTLTILLAASLTLGLSMPVAAETKDIELSSTKQKSTDSQLMGQDTRQRAKPIANQTKRSRFRHAAYQSPNVLSSEIKSEITASPVADVKSATRRTKIKPRHQPPTPNLENFRVVAQVPPPESATPGDFSTPESTDPTIQLPEFSSPEQQQQQPQQQQSPQNPESQSESAPEPRVLVAEVEVEGANEELTDIVYGTISTEPGRTTTRSQLQEDVNAIYATGFFQNVEVAPTDTPLGVRITFSVKSNPVLNKVVVETVTPEEERVLPPKVVKKIFSSSYGKILNLRELQNGIIKLNEWYSNNGYELAQVVGSPQVSKDGTVTLIVAEGVIEDIQVRFFDEDDEPAKGKTREFIVTREMELKPGDVFKRNLAQKDLQRIFGLGIFEDARFSFSPGEDPSKVVVNVDLVESSSGSVAAGAGFSSSSGLFGTVSFQQQNLGGNNQTLGTELQLGEREFLFDLNFTDPWIAGSESRTSYTVNAFRRRSISLVFDGDGNDIRTDNGNDSPRVVRTGGGISFSRPLPSDPFIRRNWTLSTGFQYQHVVIKNSDGDTSPVSTTGENLALSDDGSDDLFIFNFRANRDRRNNGLQPTKGSLLRLGVEQTAPLGSGSILFNRLRANYSLYFPIELIKFSDGPQALAFNLQAGTIIGDLPPYEAFVLGGSNSVRGFGDGELGSGRSYAQATVEYRFPVYKIVGGALFFDYGTTLGSDSEVPGEPSVTRGLPGDGYGYGIGVRVQSPLGPIRVDYAINDDSDTEIQFGIGEKF